RSAAVGRSCRAAGKRQARRQGGEAASALTASGRAGAPNTSVRPNPAIRVRSPMARRSPKTITTTWILLSAALALLVDSYRDQELAKRALLGALAAGAVPWRCAGFEGRREPGDPDSGDRRFWRERGGNQIHLRVYWEEDSAETWAWRGRYLAFHIELLRKNVRELMVGPKRRPGPGAERTYDHEAFIAASGRVLARGRPTSKQVYFDQVRAEVPRGTKLPPADDNTTLNRIVGHLWDDGKPAKS